MIESIPSLRRIIRLALEEDLGSGDITTDALIDPWISGNASLFVREEIVLAGLPLFKRVLQTMDSQIEYEEYFNEGDRVSAGKEICLLKGSLSSILKGERTALNFLQRMCGIATLTSRYVETVKPFGARILDTRKTAPGLRWLDKYAVRIGGGSNHRFGLFDGILIKDNHIAAVGSITRAVELARRKAPHTLRIEVEVEDLAGADEAFKAGADAILLDNMALQQMHKVVQSLKGRLIIEASGGITLESVLDVAKTGVDVISVGALTHSARTADLSLEVIPEAANSS